MQMSGNWSMHAEKSCDKTNFTLIVILIYTYKNLEML